MGFRDNSKRADDQLMPVSPVEYLRSLKRSEAPAAPSSPAKPAESGPVAGARGSGERKETTERRASPRYKCEGSVQFRSAGSEVRTWGTLTDISRSGCYVEMQATSPVNTEFDMLIEIAGIRFHTRGKVRVSYPFLGMGIEFKEMLAHDRESLEAIVLRLGEGVVAKPESAGPDVTQILKPEELLEALAGFFASRAILTREEFSEMVANAARRQARH